MPRKPWRFLGAVGAAFYHLTVAMTSLGLFSKFRRRSSEAILFQDYGSTGELFGHPGRPWKVGGALDAKYRYPSVCPLDSTAYVVKVTLVSMRLSHTNAYPPHLMLVYRSSPAYGAPYGEYITKPMLFHNADHLLFSFRSSNVFKGPYFCQGVQGVWLHESCGSYRLFGC